MNWLLRLDSTVVLYRQDYGSWVAEIPALEVADRPWKGMIGRSRIKAAADSFSDSYSCSGSGHYAASYRSHRTNPDIPKPDRPAR